MRKYGSEKVILVYTEILVNQRYWFIQRRWISSKAEKIKKDIQKLFKDNHLLITMQYCQLSRCYL